MGLPGGIPVSAQLRKVSWRGSSKRFGSACESRTGQRGKYRRSGLFVEQSRLRGGGCGRGRLAAGDSNNAENRHFRQRGARNEDAIGGGVQVRMRDLHPVIEQGEQIVGDDAFQGFAVGVAKTYPQAVEFGPAKKRLPLRLEIVG